MKRKYIIISIIILWALGVILVFKTFDIRKSPNVSPNNIIDKFDKTAEIKYLKSIYKVSFKNQKNHIAFKIEGILNDVKVDHEYKVEISNGKILGTVNKENNIDTFLYLAIIDSVFQNYGYNEKSTKFVYNSSAYILEKMGIYKTNEDNTKFDFVIDTSIKRKIPKDTQYISYDNLKYRGFDELMKTYDNFNIHEGKIFVFKMTMEKNSVKIFVIENGNLSNDSYKTVCSLVEVLLKDKNYNNFHKKYKELKDITYANLKIDVDYQLDKDEKISLLENDKLIKITYTYDDAFTLPDINFDLN